MKLQKHPILMLFLLCFSSMIAVFAQDYSGSKDDIKTILQNAKDFSRAYVQKDFDALANSYTMDGKILPPGADIITGRKAIKIRWTLPVGVKILEHKITPTEIKIIGDHAYDMGYYEGRTRRKDGSEVSWKGKYIIVWRQINGNWLMHLDIWNNID